MWGVLGGLLVVFAIIFFIQGYPGRGLVLLSPFILFGVVVVIMTLFMSARERAKQRQRREEEAVQQAKDEEDRRQLALTIKPLRDQVLNDVRLLEDTIGRQRTLVARKIEEARSAGAPPAKITALEECHRDLEYAVQVSGSKDASQFPRITISSSHYVQPKRTIGTDWSEGITYDAWQDSDFGDWRRDLKGAEDLIELALGYHADFVRRRWPQLVDELNLSRHSRRNL